MKTKMRLDRLYELGLKYDEMMVLRRASMTLSRWAELECGDSNANMSWAIERDDQFGWKMTTKGCVEDPTHIPTGKPFMVYHSHHGYCRTTYVPIADRERGALKRIAAICEAHGLYFYHQGDPRGAALYVSNEPLTDSDYPKGVVVCK